MTNKEAANNFAEKYKEHSKPPFGNLDITNAFNAGAEWKEKDFIEKAINFFSNRITDKNKEYIFIESFKNAVK